MNQVEYKAKPRQPEDTHPRDDPRNSDLYFLLEERVPVVSAARRSGTSGLIPWPLAPAPWPLLTTSSGLPARRRRPEAKTSLLPLLAEEEACRRWRGGYRPHRFRMARQRFRPNALAPIDDQEVDSVQQCQRTDGFGAAHVAGSSLFCCISYQACCQCSDSTGAVEAAVKRERWEREEREREREWERQSNDGHGPEIRRDEGPVLRREKDVAEAEERG